MKYFILYLMLFPSIANSTNVTSISREAVRNLDDGIKQKIISFECKNQNEQYSIYKESNNRLWCSERHKSLCNIDKIRLANKVCILSRSISKNAKKKVISQEPLVISELEKEKKRMALTEELLEIKKKLLEIRRQKLDLNQKKFELISSE